MKYYRRWQRLVRQRRRNQPIFTSLTFGAIILCLLAIIFYFRRNIDPEIIGATTEHSLQLASNCHCSRSSFISKGHGECFFDGLVCYPGFTGHRCDIPIKNESYRSHCPPNLRGMKWTSALFRELQQQCSKSPAATREWNSSCVFLCFYHRLTGITQVPSVFWYNSLNNELIYWKDNPTTVDDRLHEHVEGFHGYRDIPIEIKSIVEIGAGPFTQIQYLLTPFRSIQQVTLIEPNAVEYMKMNNCAYRGGRLRGHPLTIIPESIEVLMKKRRRHQSETGARSLEVYQAVISINVVEHVADALEYFRGLYDLLANGGLIIFHERWYDSPPQGDCILGSAENLHPIRITRWVIDQFLSQFEPIYVNFNRTRRQSLTPCLEQGIYFIGRKRSICQ